jgi:hypothetical protein
MYLLLSSEGTTTEFLKATSIKQNSYYLGIPVEFRFYNTDYHFIRSYTKLGAVFNYRVSTSTNIDFTDYRMDVYEKEMAAQVDKPNSFNAMGYACFGLRAGRENGPSLNIELQCPAFVITPDSSSLTKPNTGAGLQITLQFPIGSK